MSDRLRDQIAVEREQLRTLLKMHELLLAKCAIASPNFVEVSALAVMLHSFYNGLENLFKRIALELDGGLPQGEEWHRQLLDSMSKPTPARPAVLSPDLRIRLRGYLDFRHFFRHSYAFQFRWEKMASLALGFPATLAAFESELDAFLLRIAGPPEPAP